METNSAAKSGILFDMIGRSEGFYSLIVEPKYRSRVNIPFRVCKDDSPNDELEVHTSHTHTLTHTLTPHTHITHTHTHTTHSHHPHTHSHTHTHTHTLTPHTHAHRLCFSKNRPNGVYSISRVIDLWVELEHHYIMPLVSWIRRNWPTLCAGFTKNTNFEIENLKL